MFDGVFDNQGYELVWMDNIIEAYFIHVQGSAAIELENGEIYRVNYAGQNGHKFRFISRYMLDHGMLEPNNVSLQSIKKYLNSHPEDIQSVLSYDKSFVYFRKVSLG